MKQIVLAFLILFFSFGFSIPKKTEKKIDKEIISIFDIDSYISIDDEVKKNLLVKFNDENFFKILNDSIGIGYFYLGNAPSKTDKFDFLVIFDNELIIKKIKILAYRENYGNEISSKRWLKQFNDLTMDKTIVYRKDIKAISGATISARSMTKAINDLLQSLAILQIKNQL
jgi:Na+-translocating ferredoxin:NAD+ oxidoreductase RnfG subunit